jgi:4-diphosphocytidyl-2-C-methyl-D-erythritol kinase
MKAPPRRATVHGAAKINLGWRVGPRREDGYHEVSGLLQSISLADRLVISTDTADQERLGAGFCFDVGAQVTLKVHSSPELESESNLICRAAELIAGKTEPAATTIELEKRIPVAAGLGGGSADAAAALVGLNTVWGARLTASQLVEMGADVGSDVPAMLIGGLVHASGRGERAKRVGSYTAGWIVIGTGEERVSAAAAYEEFDRLRPDGTDPESLHHNDLERATLELVPGLRERLDAMREAAGVAFVSGSGPAVVGVVDSQDAAERVKSRVATAFDEVVVAQPVDWGVRLVLSADTGQ